MDSCVMPSAKEALHGGAEPMRVPEKNTVHGTRLRPPFPEGSERAIFGMGCFWGAEKKFWQLDGVYSTAVGYAGGYTRKPTHPAGCSRATGPAAVVLVVCDPKRLSYRPPLQAFLGPPH